MKPAGATVIAQAIELCPDGQTFECSERGDGMRGCHESSVVAWGEHVGAQLQMADGTSFMSAWRLRNVAASVSPSLT